MRISITCSRPIPFGNFGDMIALILFNLSMNSGSTANSILNFLVTMTHSDSARASLPEFGVSVPALGISRPSPGADARPAVRSVSILRLEISLFPVEDTLAPPAVVPDRNADSVLLQPVPIIDPPSPPLPVSGFMTNTGLIRSRMTLAGRCRATSISISSN